MVRAVPDFASLIRATASSDSKHNSAFSRHGLPEVCMNVRPSSIEGAGNAGCALHPRSRVQNCAKNAHTSIQVQRKQSDFPCAMVLTVYSALSPVIGLV